MVNYLGVDDKAGALLMVAPTQQDQRFVSLSMELPSPTTNTSTHVSANFAPNQANGCGASYDAVTYWPKTCDELGSQNFAAFKSLGRIKKDVRVLDGGATLKVFLLPAGSGCVSIRKEVVL